MARSILLVRRWRAQPERRHASRGAMLWHIGLPLVINLAWGIAALIVLPSLLGLPRRMFAVMFPDVGAILTLSAVVALGWGLLRTALAIVTLRESRAPIAAGAQSV